MSSMSRQSTSNEEEYLDTGSGSGSRTRNDSSFGQNFSEVDLNSTVKSISSKTNSFLGEKTHIYLLSLAFGLSSFLLFLTFTTATQNQKMLVALHPYAVDLANVTNTTWGYGGMPVNMNADDKMGGHSHGKPTQTETALDPEDTAILMKDVWRPPQGNFPFSIFPTTTDTLDELRPDEVVKYETNYLVKKHVSTVMQYNRRIAPNETYRSTHTICKVQGFIPPYQSVINNKTFTTSNSPIDVWLLETPLDGEWWSGKGFNEGGLFSLRSNMTWNSKPTRKRKLGTIHAWPGVNMDAPDSFDCPKVTGRKGERIAIEYTCTPGPTEDSCYLSFDARMTYPVLMFEVVF